MRGVYSVFARRAILLWLCFVAGTGGGAAVARTLARAGDQRWAACVALERSYPEPAEQVLAGTAAGEGAYVQLKASGTTTSVLVPAETAQLASEKVDRIISKANAELRARAAARLRQLRERGEAARGEAEEARKHIESAAARRDKIRGALVGEFNELMRPTGLAESRLVELVRERERLEAKLAESRAVLRELDERMRSLPEMIVVRTERPEWISHPGYLSLKKKREKLKRSLDAASPPERQAVADELRKIEDRLARIETLTKDPPVRVEEPNPARAKAAARARQLEEELASTEALLERAKGSAEAVSARVKKVLEGSKEAEMLEVTIAERRARAGELARESNSLEDEARGLEAALAGPSPLTPSRAVEAPEEARMSWREVVGLGMALGVLAGLALLAVAEAVKPAVRTPEELQELLGIPPVAVIRGTAPGAQIPDWRSAARRRRARIIRWVVAAALAAILAGGAVCWPEIRGFGGDAGKEARE